MNILYTVAAMGGIAAILGMMLAAASRLFRVEEDVRVAQLVDILPGANCGACGCAGCGHYASALLTGAMNPGDCPVGDDDCTAAQAAIIGVEIKKNLKNAAFVACSGGDQTERKYDYIGISDCRAAVRLDGGPMACPNGCVGLGSCIATCRFGAIEMHNGVARVDDSKCTGCLRCVSICPKFIIHPVPAHTDVNIACSSHQRGAVLKKVCNIGCLGCHICEKACPENAITVENNLAKIDFAKCTGCGECATCCPRHLIYDAKLERDVL